MSVAALYNSIITVEEADCRFKNREVVFSKLAPLLAAYQQQFGVCLVHTHCTLEEGQTMVAEGNITSPVDDGLYYPERWLADGTPFEYSSQPTKIPPPELFEQFQEITREIGVLGLFYAGNLNGGQPIPPGKILLERTEGQHNIVELVDEAS